MSWECVDAPKHASTHTPEVTVDGGFQADDKIGDRQC